MKQLLIVSNSTLNGGAAAPKDLSEMAKGSIGFFALDDYDNWLSAATTKNFGIALGGYVGVKNPKNTNAFVIPEVDFSSLTVVETTPQTGNTFTATIAVPATVVKGKEYTVILIKKGVVRHERNTWSAVAIAKDTDGKKVASDLVAQFNASSETSNIEASVPSNSSTITLTGTSYFEDFNVKTADELASVTPTVTNAKPSTCDQAYIQDLASRCAAGKGFNYTAEDAHEMYPGYPETVANTTYNLYTLRFKVGRSGAKQRDEQVYQIVHIAIPTTATTLITSVKAILGVGTTPTPSVEDGD